MGKEVAPRQQCPNCKALGRDTDKDNLATYDNGTFCQGGCGHSELNVSPAPQVQGLVPGDIHELADRGILKTTCEKYNVRTAEFTGKLAGQELVKEPIIIFPIYENGRVVKQKVRSKNIKKVMSQLGQTDCMKLFGQNCFSPNKSVSVIVTEGEYDAMAMHQMSGLPAVSIVRGAQGAQKEILENLEWLSGFKDVLLCFDMDNCGREAVEACVPIFEPGTVKNLTLPLKDANEVLLAGREGEIKKCIWNAEVIRPKTIVFPNDIRDEVLVKPKFGTPWPWDFMTKVTYGNRLGEVYMLAGDTSVGKMNPLSTLIATPTGWKKMGDIQVGDVIHGYDNHTIVIGVYPQGVKPVYRLTFSDGRSCEAGLEHLWEVKTHKQLQNSRLRGENITSRLTTKEMMEYRGKKGLFIKTCKAVTNEAIDYLVPPYILGVLIGDGCLTLPGLQFSTSEIELVNKISSAVESSYVKNPSSYTYRFYSTETSKKYKAYLKLVGLNIKSPFRFIPKEYLQGSIEQRLDLLKGLMDTDGHVTKEGAYRFHTTSVQLKDDVLELCRGLGYIARFAEDIRDKYTTGVCYYISIKTQDVIVSSIKHLAKLEAENKVKRNRKYYYDHIKLKSIEYVREEESQCIMVDSPDHLYLINDYVVTHNTQIIYQIISQHINNGCKVGLIDLERQNVQTLQRVISGMINKRIYLPDCTDFDTKEIGEQIDKLQDSLALYRPESGKLSVESILINIRYLCKAYKINFFVLDNLTALATGATGGLKDYEIASQTVGQLVQVARELNITLFIVNHLVKDPINLTADITMPEGHDYNASKEGLTWETGRMPGVGHIYGGGKVAKLPDYLMVVARNRMSSDKDIQKTIIVKFLKTRMESSHEGEEFQLSYDVNSGQLLEKRSWE